MNNRVGWDSITNYCSFSVLTPNPIYTLQIIKKKPWKYFIVHNVDLEISRFYVFILIIGGGDLSGCGKKAFSIFFFISTIRK